MNKTIIEWQPRDKFEHTSTYNLSVLLANDFDSKDVEQAHYKLDLVEMINDAYAGNLNISDLAFKGFAEKYVECLVNDIKDVYLVCGHPTGVIPQVTVMLSKLDYIITNFVYTITSSEYYYYNATDEDVEKLAASIKDLVIRAIDAYILA